MSGFCNLFTRVLPTAQAGVKSSPILHDVTEQRTLERLLKQSNVELERQVAVRTAELEATVGELERANAGKDAFMAAISHELLTPLMGVLGMGELLESEVRGTLNPDQARAISVRSAKAANGCWLQ